MASTLATIMGDFRAPEPPCELFLDCVPAPGPGTGADAPNPARATSVSSRSLTTSAWGSLDSCGNISHDGKNSARSPGALVAGSFLSASAGGIFPADPGLPPSHVSKSCWKISWALSESATTTMGRAGCSLWSHAAIKGCACVGAPVQAMDNAPPSSKHRARDCAPGVSITLARISPTFAKPLTLAYDDP